MFFIPPNAFLPFYTGCYNILEFKIVAVPVSNNFFPNSRRWCKDFLFDYKKDYIAVSKFLIQRFVSKRPSSRLFFKYGPVFLF